MLLIRRVMGECSGRQLLLALLQGLLTLGLLSSHRRELNGLRLLLMLLAALMALIEPMMRCTFLRV